MIVGDRVCKQTYVRDEEEIYKVLFSNFNIHEVDM